jgi:hypothetical protein
MTGTTSAAPAMRTSTSAQSIWPPLRGSKPDEEPTIIQSALRLIHKASTATPTPIATSATFGPGNVPLSSRYSRQKYASSSATTPILTAYSQRSSAAAKPNRSSMSASTMKTT